METKIINFADFDPDELDFEAEILEQINTNPNITTGALSKQLEAEREEILTALERLYGNMYRMEAVNQWMTTKRISRVLDSLYNEKIEQVRQDKPAEKPENNNIQ
ncbi:MAG: hypothetical protein KAJ51_01855 [Thermoplasmata archaeon]|nr:hypothetical protein [Thermoplasmata archaeon]